jgi:hypothetical protein
LTAWAELKAEGKCPEETEHRQVMSLNDVVEPAPNSARWAPALITES